jgi:hypothetical protein
VAAQEPTMTTMTHAETYVRTEAGKAEFRSRTLALSRPARNLLMVIDASCSGDAWVAKVTGSTPADLEALLAAGLVAPQGGPAKVVQRQVAVEDAVRDWTYDALYTLLTQEAKERFGLIKGYRLILKIEGCSDLAGMQAVALEFVEQIRKAHGEDSAARFRKQLGAS